MQELLFYQLPLAELWFLIHCGKFDGLLLTLLKSLLCALDYLIYN